MTNADGDERQCYLTLLGRGEEILATIKLMRRSENADEQEIVRLNQELSQVMDEMTALIPTLTSEDRVST